MYFNYGKITNDQEVHPYKAAGYKQDTSGPGVRGEKSMTYSPVSCSRPTLLLTTVS